MCAVALSDGQQRVSRALLQELYIPCLDRLRILSAALLQYTAGLTNLKYTKIYTY